jgi:lipid-binding SYLF domain-containing protein
MKKFILALAFICLIPLHHAHAASREEQRAEIQRMKSNVLDRLYKAQPQAKDEIAHAVGYAAFSSADVAAIFFSGSYGHGIAHDNRTGMETFMQMASAGVGLGVGVKDFRAVFVFNDKDAFENFVKTGLDLSANADLSIKQGSKGGALTGAGDVLPGVRVYQLTDTGLMAQAMLKGTKYWRDSDLNGDAPTAGAATTTRPTSDR